MNRVWQSAPYTGESLLVLLALADWANDDGVAWPSMEQLAKKARCSVRQAQRIVRKLEDDGAIYVDRATGRGHTHTYFITLKGDISSAKGDNMTPIAEQERVTSETLKGDISSIKGDISSIKGDIPFIRSVIEPSIEPSKNRQDRERAKRTPRPPPRLTGQERQNLHERYDPILGHADVEEAIAAALAHTAARKWTNTHLYVNNWLRREVNSTGGRQQGRSPPEYEPGRGYPGGRYSHLFQQGAAGDGGADDG